MRINTRFFGRVSPAAMKHASKIIAIACVMTWSTLALPGALLHADDQAAETEKFTDNITVTIRTVDGGPVIRELSPIFGDGAAGQAAAVMG
jgi:hypothetical protein